MGTLSKALGSLGGFAAGSATLIDYLVNTARSFIFATALPPFLCVALEKALDVLKEEPWIRQNLWKNIQKVHEALSRLKLISFPIQSPIFPLLIGEEKEALKTFHQLLEAGLYIPAIRYPTVAKGKARLRITVSAVHAPEDLDRLFRALGPLSGETKKGKT